MSDNIYDIMNKLNSLQPSEETEPKNTEVQYEDVEPRGSITDAVQSLTKKYEDFVTDENQQLDERQFSDKKTFDQLAEPGDTYKTADGGTVTKTEKGIKHSAPSGKYGAGPEDDKDELDENTSENTLEENKELRNHPIYTKEEAWDHYQKELAEQEVEETVDINTELDEISRLAGLEEKVGGNKAYDFLDDIEKKKDKDCKEGFDPETYEKEIEYEFAGDDGEPGYGHIQYTVNVVDGKPVVDPASLKATCNGDGNNKLTDEWCSEMVSPGGSEHEEALLAAQEEADDEWESRDVDVPMDEGDEQLEEGPTRKDFQMVADLLKNIDDEDKRKELAHHHADTFAQQNPRFDRARFLSAVGLNEDDVEEGNEFSGALAKAKAEGKKEFEVDGKTYKVEEAKEKPDYIDLDKDGDKEESMKKAAKDKEEMKEDINVNVTANGEEDALKLMMKLAGVQAVAVQQVQQEEAPCDACGADPCGCETMEEERDIEYANTPDEETAPVSAVTSDAGSGMNGPKKQYPARADVSANPLEEDLWKAYESMVNDIKQVKESSED